MSCTSNSGKYLEHSDSPILHIQGTKTMYVHNSFINIKEYAPLCRKAYTWKSFELTILGNYSFHFQYFLYPCK